MAKQRQASVQALLLWAILALTAALACGGDTSSPPPAPAHSATPVPTAVVEASNRGAGDVIQAQRLLLEHYVSPVPAASLLDAAWAGAIERARQAGADDRRLPLAPITDVPESAQPAFEMAFGLLREETAHRVSGDTLARAAIAAMARSLNDSHTRFVPPETWQSSGRLSPLFQFRTLPTESGLLIWDVTPGRNAFLAGLRPGDYLLSVNGVAATERERPASVDPSRPAMLRVRRPNAGVLELQVMPEPDESPPFDTRLFGDIAYVQLYAFLPRDRELAGGSFQDVFTRAVRELAAAGPAGWVLDLRGCPGGNLSSLAFVAGLFGARGLVYEATQRSGATRTVSASGDDAVAGKPLAVLVNGSSASAAEVLTATLQDLGLALVIGTRTARGVNGALRYPLDSGGGLFITVEQSRAGPGRRVLEGAGVTPDELVVLNVEEIATGRDNQMQRALAYVHEQAARGAGP